MKRNSSNLINKKVTKAIFGLLANWNKKGFSPRAINTGNCWKFADQLAAKFPDGSAMWGKQIAGMFPNGYDPDGHCFFFLAGMFYDSEAPGGVSSPHLLAYYKRGGYIREGKATCPVSA